MKGFYIGVDGKARKVKKVYIGVDGVARKVKKAYIGDENGKARLCWTSDFYVKELGVKGLSSGLTYTENKELWGESCSADPVGFVGSEIMVQSQSKTSNKQLVGYDVRSMEITVDDITGYNTFHIIGRTSYTSTNVSKITVSNVTTGKAESVFITSTSSSELTLDVSELSGKVTIQIKTNVTNSSSVASTNNFVTHVSAMWFTED